MKKNKKTMRKLFLLALILTSTFTNAQNSEKAKTLLDKVYNKVKSYDNIFVDFKYTLNNTEVNINQETRGNVTLSGDKYVLNSFGAQQLFDGSKVYTIVPDNEEVTIESKTDDESISPSKMLTFYKEGHTYQWDILQNVKGRKIQFVKLIPIDTNSEIATILLGIDIETDHISKLIYTGKDATKTTIIVNSFKTNQSLSKTLFTFDENKYKEEGYYIIRN